MRFLSLRFSFLFAFLIAFSLVQTLATTLPKHHENEERDGHSRLHRPSSRSLLSFPLRVATTALVVTLDGTMYLVDNSPGSMKVIWSFSTGSPIYQSYRAPVESDTDKENSSAALMSGFVECGDDWSLYMHDRHFGKMVCILRYIRAL
ncbi:serine/threonine-protein kinase/endoribonuclease IRE1b-like [Vigna radiata var. radiata]|uniref:Serine/threonine-protein kinase/endoribonuclease IRE1b-like n=1 Tax=Vigna radiata var. radiata TaxID=3916 RepID=A0A3Q0F3R7_VIGRR|nr:serine/threonine-protein kinase/endoribonuclease IRE1b-like [Vigna radiata var. radiata]